MDFHDSKELERLKKAKVKAEKNEKLQEVANLCNAIGALYSKYERFEESIQEHKTELHLYEALGDTIGSAVACRLIGECFCALEQFDKALSLQQRHLSLARSCDSVVEEQRALATIGRTYLFQGELAKTKKLRMDALKKAEDAFLKSLEICKQLKSSVQENELMEMRSRLLLNLGLVCDARGDIRAAEVMMKAVTIATKLQTQDDLYRCQFSLSGVYQRNENYSQALRLMEKACGSARKMRNKHFESDAVVQKALILLHLEDYRTVRHLLKKAKKLGFPTEAGLVRLKVYYKSTLKMEEASEELKSLKEGDHSKHIQLYETLADCAAETGNYKQAIKYYSKMLFHSRTAGRSGSDLIPVYVSLAQTYKDDKQYDKAIEYFLEEIHCRQPEETDQICRTWLNIAEAQEFSGESYNNISKSYQQAYDCARRAKNRKLQIQCLTSLTELQKVFQQQKHLAQTEEKLEYIRQKFNITLEDELEDDTESQDVQEFANEDDADFSMSELSESDSEEIDRVGKGDSTRSNTAKRFTQKRNEKGETPLHRACIEGNLKKVKKLIEQGHPPNPRDYCGWIPLHEAANHDFYEITEYLLEHGAAVNDRGGQLCGGVTPLMDAANCGNLEIMQLLIDKGANVLAKSDENQTALECLQQWKNRCEDGDLNSAILARYENMVQLLIERMPSHGGSYQRRSIGLSSLSPSRMLSQREVTSPDSNRGTRASSKHKRPRVGVSQRRSRNDVINYSDSDSDSHSPRRVSKPLPSLSPSRTARATLESDQEDSDDVYFNPLLEDCAQSSNSATDTYRNAMSSIGSAANRVIQSQSKPSRQKSTADGPALVNEEEYVDDWLIDDLQPTKRRKMDVNGLFSTRSVKSGAKTSVSDEVRDDQSEPRRKLSASQKQNRTRIIDSDSESESMLKLNGNCDSPIRDNLFDTEKENDGGNMTLIIEDFDSDNDLPVISKNSPQKIISKSSANRSRPRQLKMTDYGSVINSAKRLEPSSSVEQSVFSVINPSQPGTCGRTTELVTGSNTSVAMTMGGGVAVTGVMGVKVTIKDKTLFIPVKTGVGKTISWLAHEASQRYYSLCGLKPTLTLSTKDGAYFSPEDPIDLVLQGIEKIEASVESWDLPPLADRYREACKSLSTVCYTNVRTLLQSCEDNGILILKELSLRTIHFKPVVRALQCKTNLRELHLQGNRIGDLGLENLCNTLATLPSLTLLNIAGNDITSVGLSHLSSTAATESTNTGKTKCLQHLTSLDLSYNCLCDGSAGHIVTLLTSLPQLTSLTLRSCSLTAHFIHHHRLQLSDALHRSSLHSLDISCNTLGCVGVELLLICLDEKKMSSLNLSSCVSPTSSQLVQHLYSYMVQENCGMKELVLDDCHLSNEDADTLARFVRSSKSLKKLSLSRNTKLDTISIGLLLQSTAVEWSVLDELECIECSVKSPLSVDFLDALSEKMNSEVPLRKFHLSIHKLEKVDTDCLKQVWSEKWGENGAVVSVGQSVEMNVVDR